MDFKAANFPNDGRNQTTKHEISSLPELNANQENRPHIDAEKLIWNEKAGSRFSTLISLCELHTEQNDIGFITAKLWWRARWVKVLTRGNGRAFTHWLRAHHRRSRVLRGRWPLSRDWLDEEGQVSGVKRTHSWGTISEKRENVRSVGHNNPAHLHRLYNYTFTHTCLYRQLECHGDDDNADAGGTSTAFRWLTVYQLLSLLSYPCVAQSCFYRLAVLYRVLLPVSVTPSGFAAHVHLCTQHSVLSALQSRLHKVKLEGYRDPWAEAIQNDVLVYPSRPFCWYNISISHSLSRLDIFDG